MGQGGHTHKSDLDRHQCQLPGQPHQDSVILLLWENFEYLHLHRRLNEESYDCDSDLHHREHDLVFDYDNFQHGDHHE